MNLKKNQQLVSDRQKSVKVCKYSLSLKSLASMGSASRKMNT